MSTIETAPGTALVRLLHLVSPALPVGAYAWSHGLESAVEQSWVVDEKQARDWILGLLGHTLASVDAPVLYRMCAAWKRSDQAGAERWNQLLRATRETAELAAEDCHIGRALARLLADLGIAEARVWAARDEVSYPLMFALAAARWGVGTGDAVQGYLWSWTENQTAAAVRLVPLGQTAGQRILYQATDRIERIAHDAAHMADEQIGATAPGLAAVSALHETQYSRLFRS